MYFVSDNQTGASDKVISTLLEANKGVSGSYGEDCWSQKAESLIQQMFETDARVYFVSTGTAANCLALSCLVNPWQKIIAHGQGHILNDELTAPEFFTHGARLIGLDERRAKLTVDSFTNYLTEASKDETHSAQPAALSLTQMNENGQIYSIDELKQFGSIAKKHGLKVHMDGARFANAVVSLGCHPADISWKAGVDVLCLGATKNGALSAEAVVFFDNELANDFDAHRKRSGHLISKSRWLGAQFTGWLEGNHWRDLAEHANNRAQELSKGIDALAFTKIVWPTCGNEVFAIMPHSAIKHARAAGARFAEWPASSLPEACELAENESLLRFVTSFNTTKDDVRRFLSLFESWAP